MTWGMPRDSIYTASTRTSIDTIDSAMIQHSLHVESSNFNVEHHISNKNVESKESMNSIKVECQKSNEVLIESSKFCVEFKPYNKSINLKGLKKTKMEISREINLS